MPRRIQLAAMARQNNETASGDGGTGPLVSEGAASNASPAAPKAKARKVPASGVRRKPAAKSQGGRKAVR